MSLSVCPTARVEAPAERVWALLADPACFDSWWDARLVSAEPAGRAQAGQVIRGRTRAFGREWPVSLRVLAVDPDRYQIDLATTLPFGLTMRNHIACSPLDEGSCRLSFG
jgi:hypothetical protein